MPQQLVSVQESTQKKNIPFKGRKTSHTCVSFSGTAHPPSGMATSPKPTISDDKSRPNVSRAPKGRSGGGKSLEDGSYQCNSVILMCNDRLFHVKRKGIGVCVYLMASSSSTTPPVWLLLSSLPCISIRLESQAYSRCLSMNAVHFIRLVAIQWAQASKAAQGETKQDPFEYFKAEDNRRN